MFRLIITAIITICHVTWALAAELQATLQVEVTNDVASKATIEINGPQTLQESHIVFLIIPFQGLNLDDYVDNFIALPTTDELKQTIISLYIPKQTRFPIKLEGTLKIQPLDASKLKNLGQGSNRQSFIYRTTLGIDEQISICLSEPDASKYTKLIDPDYKLGVSEVKVTFQEGTTFTRDPALKKFEFNNVDGWTYVLKYEPAPQKEYYAVQYKLSTEARGGKVLLSILVALIGASSIAVESMNKSSRFKIILYSFVFAFYVVTILYCIIFNWRYLLENYEAFIAPTASAFAVLIALVRSIKQSKNGGESEVKTTSVTG